MNEMSMAIDQTIQSELEGKSLTFYIGDTVYGLPLTHVIEIINAQPVTKVPGTPAYVKGIINLRGSIMPLVDVRLKFGQEERPHDEQTNFIITQLDDMQVGLVVDRVSNVIKAQEVSVSTLPEFSSVNSNQYMTSVSRVGDQLVMNLSCETMLGDDNI